MRSTTYKCDRCGKHIAPRSVAKINANIQRGMNPVEKQTYDFCSNCFLKIKKAFKQSLEMDEGASVTEETVIPVTSVEKLVEKPAISPVIEIPVKEQKGDKLSREEMMNMFRAGQTEKTEPETEPETKHETEPKTEPKTESEAVKSGEVKLGPISKEERLEILRMHAEEGLTPEEIAARMNRVTRDIKRAINSASKSGELNKMHAAYQEKLEAEKAKPVPPVAEDEDVEPESYAGSGASDSGIMKDSYTAPPQREIVDGKKYDVGGILALAKAGWSSNLIAEERHYDEDVVRMLLDKYL